MTAATAIRSVDVRSDVAALRADVFAGLAARPKRLPSKWFYDARGSALFEAICAQPEYYLTRVELAIMQAQAASIAAAIGPRARIIEFGSGAGLKTRLLLSALQAPTAYVPVEISGAALDASCARLAEALPALRIQPVEADFTASPPLPAPPPGTRRSVLYFPGSTLGNFDGAEAQALLQSMRRIVGERGAVLIGLDLKKDVATLEAAYNDAAGVTAAFTLNLLERINRELGADFDIDGFGHRAVYNALAGRIETHVVSRRAQTVSIGGRRFEFARDEAMLVEVSCKYSDADVARLAARAGLRIGRDWRDADARFGVFLLEPVVRGREGEA